MVRRGLVGRTALVGLILMGARGSAAGAVVPPAPIMVVETTRTDKEVLALDSAWEFWPGRLLEPGDPDNPGTTPARPLVGPLSPNRWVAPALGDLPPTGYGTYRIILEFPRGMPESYGIMTGPFNTSAALWWNGEPVASFGSPGRTKGSTTTSFEHRVVHLPPLPPGTTRGELLIQVANFHNTSLGGFTMVPLVGSLEALHRAAAQGLALWFSLAGFVIALGIYHGIRWFFQKTQASLLAFAFICAALGTRILFVDTMPILQVLPDLGWSTALAVNYATFPILVAGFAVFIAAFFPSAPSKFWALVASIGSMAFLVLVVLSPTELFTLILPAFQIFSLAIGLVVLAILVHGVLTMRRGAGILSLGFLSVLGTSVVDIVAVAFRLPLPSMSVYGIITFMLLEAVALALQSADGRKELVSLSDRLADVNKAQARFLPRELLQQLNATLVTELDPGDCVQGPMAVLVLDYGITFTDNVDKEELARLLNSFHATLGPLVRTHGGFVTLYQSDGLVALFPPGPRKALACALDCIKAGQSGRVRPGSFMTIHCAIHHGRILLGLLGEADRMNGTIMSNHMADAERLLARGTALGALVTMSQEALEKLGDLEKWQYRKIGSMAFAGGYQSIWDFFDADPEPVWRAKRKTKRVMALAIRARARGQNAEARAWFREALTAFPRDPAVRYHLGRITLRSGPTG